MMEALRLPKISLDDVVGAWRRATGYYGVPSFSDLVVDVRVRPAMPPKMDDKVMDWWPVGAIRDRTRSINRYGPVVGVRWETRKGTLETVCKLEEAGGDEGLERLVWIGAALNDFGNDMPEAWRGPSYGILVSATGVVRSALDEAGLWWWHHSAREAIPGGVSTIGWLIADPDLDGIVAAAFASVCEGLLRWAPVRVTLAEEIHAVVGQDHAPGGFTE